MAQKLIITIILILLISSLTLFYFVPLSITRFESKSGNSNFSLVSEETMQFYQNMRFPETRISYRIIDCPFSKQDDMKSAFEIMGNLTLLKFYPVGNNEEISVTCEERTQARGSMFIAGEGGPTKIIAAGKFAVIFNGEISLIKESECSKPNIALHELLHVLGFQHSTNPDNIMYNTTKCSQEIGGDILQSINYLYSIPSYPDLAIENASAYMNGRYLTLSATIINEGLDNAEKSNLVIYADGEIVKKMPMDSIEIGKGRFVSIKNIWIPQIKVDRLELSVETPFSEISKENNKVRLEVKK